MAPSPQRRKPVFPWWLLALALLGLVLAWAIFNDASYSEIFAVVSKGVVTTLWVALLAFALAAILGLAVALLRTSGNALLEQAATFYIEVLRGVPILVALFYIAFVGAPALVDAANFVLSPAVNAGWMGKLSIRSFDLTWRAIFALTVCYSAFIAEIFRAGIEAVDGGQIEAAKALGLSRRRTFQHVVAPQALRTILPPLGNDFVSMIKDSALVSALGVQDITQLGKVYSSSNFRFFETYNVVAYLYLIMTISLSLLVRLLERRMRRNHR